MKPLECKEFLSSNGLKMIEGISYNWRLINQFSDGSGDQYYVIHIGSMLAMIQFIIDKDCLLSISYNIAGKHVTVKFSFESLEKVEDCIDAYLKANSDFKNDLKDTIYSKEFI